MGKSTLAREVAKRLSGVYLTESVDELIAPPRFGPNSPDKLAGQFWHARQVLLKEQQITDSQKHYICDRGWADIYAYSRSILPEKDRDLFFAIADHLPKKLPDVHIVAYATPEVLVDRISRRNRDNLEAWAEDDIDYALKINQAFLDFSTQFKDLRPVYPVDVGGTIEENVEKVVDIIKKHI